MIVELDSTSFLLRSDYTLKKYWYTWYTEKYWYSCISSVQLEFGRIQELKHLAEILSYY